MREHLVTYTKFRFTHPVNGNTADLVMETTKLTSMTISEISRLFPESEAPKMARLERSPSFGTWEKAFNYNFEFGI